jgi:hypothetical protein
MKLVFNINLFNLLQMSLWKLLITYINKLKINLILLKMILLFIFSSVNLSYITLLY